MTTEDLERELDQGNDLDPDLSLTDNEKLQILRQLRKQAVVDYHVLKTQARLNDLVENTKQGDVQRENAKKIVLQVQQLDKEIKALESF